MATLKYTVIKDKAQYMAYCNLVEKLVMQPQPTAGVEEEIELLTTLIEVWDGKHSSTRKMDPVQLLRSFIKDHHLKPGKTMQIMGISSRGHYSEIMNYQKGLSKEVIRRLAAYFKVSQESFNRPYALKKNQPIATARSEGLAKASRTYSRSGSKPPKPAASTKAGRQSAARKKLLQAV